MTKEEKQFAKELFLKSYRDQYLTDKSIAYTISAIKNAIEVSKLYHKIEKEVINEAK